MKLIRRIIYPEGKNRPPLVVDFLTQNIDNELSAGFEKGKVVSAVIKLANGHTIEYERIPKPKKAS